MKTRLKRKGLHEAYLRWPHMKADQLRGLSMREIGGGVSQGIIVHHPYVRHAIPLQNRQPSCKKCKTKRFSVTWRTPELRLLCIRFNKMLEANGEEEAEEDNDKQIYETNK